MTKRTAKKKTDAQLRAEGVTIAEAVGTAGNGGKELAMKIEVAMQEAIIDMNSMGICDDTRSEKLVEILGPQWEGKVGADAIREAKIEARRRTRDNWHAEEAAKHKQAADALAAEGHGE